MAMIYYANQQICAECGKVLSRDAEYCTSCGSRSLSLIQCEPPWEALSIGGKIYRVILLMVAALLFFIGGPLFIATVIGWWSG